MWLGSLNGSRAQWGEMFVHGWKSFDFPSFLKSVNLPPWNLFFGGAVGKHLFYNVFWSLILKKMKIAYRCHTMKLHILNFCFLLSRKAKVREKSKRGRGTKKKKEGWSRGSGGLPPAKIGFWSLSRARWDLGVLFSGPAQWDLPLGKFSARSELFWEQK